MRSDGPVSTVRIFKALTRDKFSFSWRFISEHVCMYVYVYEGGPGYVYKSAGYL